MLDPTLARFLAQTFNAAIVSSARPGLTFVAIQWTIGVLVRMDQLTLAPALGWLISLPALLIAGLLAGLETWTRHDADAAELLRELKIDHLLGSFGVFSCALLFASLGLPEAEATALVAQDVSPDGGGLALAVSMAAGADQPVAVKAGAVAGAVGIHSAMTWARSQLMAFLAEFELESLWARLETGGVAAVLLALLLAPYLAAAFLLLASGLLVAVALLIKAVQVASDRACRVPCPQCSHSVRPEARRCPECRHALTPTTLLSRSALQRGWRAARERLSTFRSPRASVR
ncbi:MAG: zinc ribbon domain-containing protein [Myxococcota bacterium]|nr:zinc ribbon domain-containing protein [Myxococcota bacterium]